jgi:type I restriction enzyme S subunit
MTSIDKPLGELTKIKTGKLDANASSEDGQYPFFTCARTPLRIDTYTYDCECVLVAGNGDLNVKYYMGKFDAYQRTYIVESTDKAVLDTRYLYRFLDRYLIRLREQSIGGVIKYIKLGNLTDAIIPLPPLPEQKRIATILDQADFLREKRRAAIAKLDELLQSVFLDMFGDPVTNPKGWPIGRIGDLLEDVLYGTSGRASTEGAWPILRMNNITYTGEWNFTDLKYIDLSEKEEAKYLVHNGDILFNRTNSKELVGKTAVYRAKDPMAFAGYLIRCRTNKNAVPDYISSYLNSQHGKLTLTGMCKSIIGMANINAKELQSIKILIPPIELQREYEQIVGAILVFKQSLEPSTRKFEALFSSLQQRAFRGEL